MLKCYENMKQSLECMFCLYLGGCVYVVGLLRELSKWEGQNGQDILPSQEINIFSVNYFGFGLQDNERTSKK